MVENSITVSVSPLQMILSVAFQAWIIIFPILIIKKLNYLTQLLQAQFEDEEKEV
jgi:hypothetical protein